MTEQGRTNPAAPGRESEDPQKMGTLGAGPSGSEEAAGSGSAGAEGSAGRDPHSGEAAEAPAGTEHGEQTGMKRLVDDLHARREKAKLGGGEEKIRVQHERGKLTARERLDLLVDPGTFVEIGIQAGPHSSQRAMDGKEAPADGVITGWGDVDGRPCCIAAYDFTVMAGSMGMTGEFKVGRLREMALQKRMPMIWLLDSAGARIQEASGSMFAGSGHLFREEVIMSGVVPMVAAMLGPCAAGTAYIPGLADFVPMVVGQGAMALAGPHLTKAVTGEDISMEDLGGAKVHCRKSGVGDLEVADDAECIDSVKRYLSFFPRNCEEKPPVGEASDPEDRMSERLLDIVPESSRQPYDMYEVIREIVDDGEYFDIKPKFAKTLITCLARFGGMPCGIVANQPKQLAGILENDSADKAARFINLCDAFSIPLLFLQDVPGFMVGSKVEQAGIIRHGAKMLYAVSRATVPKITVVVRKAYGAGYYVMNGRAYEPDLIVAWPSAEISVMGPEGAVNIIGRSAIEASEDPEKTREEMLAAVKQQIDPYLAARNDLIDDVIDPRETRPTVIRGLRMAKDKRVERPWRKHGVSPV
ncbi:MAG TPA: acyl-CoA carboxylase subunit beta [Solirubrobacterales bacterium]|nr:acyl-CoA carboxylase subunit beta [Solirubrobacterales bacterium]